MADRRLQVFHAVARLLSFTKAAEVLHMTQPAVTFQIRQLEEQFNARLFDRTHNRVTLTEAGQVVFEYSEQIFEAYAEMENAVREMTNAVNGSLNIGASTTIAEYMLPALLGEFKLKNPEIRLRLRVSNTEGIVSMVENNVIDLGVVEGPVTNKHLRVEMCKEDQLVLAVSPIHPLASRKSVALQEALEYPFVRREEGSGTREVTMDYIESQGIDKNIFSSCLELGSPEAVKGAVEANIGITILSRASIAKELKLGTLVAIPLDPVLKRDFSFVRQRQKFRIREMEDLLEFARHYCEH